MTDIEDLDGYGTAAAVRSGELSPSELVEWTIDRIDALQPLINAFTVTFPEDVRQQAKSIEASFGQRRHEAFAADSNGLLGVPIAIKDHIWMKGAPATNGSVALRDFVPDEDCVPVARVRRSGSLIVGKTNNPEFCYGAFTDNLLWGLSRNPWDLDRTTGGSSGGSAAAVAAGMVPLAMGTDAGGSIRIPACFCGVVGLKPTFGLVPKEPGFRGWKMLSANGPIARSVRDVGLMLSVIAGPASADDMSYPGRDVDYVAASTEHRDLSGLRVAYTEDMGFARLEPDVRRSFGAAVKRFAETGCELIEDYPDAPDPTALWTSIVICDSLASEGWLLREHEKDMVPSSVAVMKAALGRTAVDYISALHERGNYTRMWSSFFEEYDLLLSPMMQLTAFPVGLEAPERLAGEPVDRFFEDWCNLCYPANLTGQPAISVPAGFGDNGLPIGLQIVGRRFEDDLVLRAASAWEQIQPWNDRWPAVAPGPNRDSQSEGERRGL